MTHTRAVLADRGAAAAGQGVEAPDAVPGRRRPLRRELYRGAQERAGAVCEQNRRPSAGPERALFAHVSAGAVHRQELRPRQDPEHVKATQARPEEMTTTTENCFPLYFFSSLLDMNTHTHSPTFACKWC